MFSKEEKKAFNHLFWTSFGKYMQKHQPISGKKAKWLNYKTGVKDLYFRMDCIGKKAFFSIEFQHKDESIRALFYEQFAELRKIFTETMSHEFIWEHDSIDQFNNSYSRVYTEMIGVSKFNKNDWEKIFHFFENHIVPLDSFWSEFDELFITLQE